MAWWAQVNEVGGVVDFVQFVHIMTKKMKDCDVISEIKEVPPHPSSPLLLSSLEVSDTKVYEP